MTTPPARAWRALAFVGVAVVAVAVLAFAYLGRGPARTAAARPTPPPALREPWILLFATFGDADHGAVVMASRSGGGTYVTTDGGRTWTQRRLGTIEFLDRTHAIAVDAASRIELTADGGRSWTAGHAPVTAVALGTSLNVAVGAPDFLDPADGWWLDEAPKPGGWQLWRTGDGGRTWRPLAAAGLPSDEKLSQPAFADPLRGAVIAGPPRQGAWPSLLTTRDGGVTWGPAALPTPPAGAYTGFQPALLAAGGRLVVSMVLANGFGGFARWSSVSDDGGVTWPPWLQLPGGTASLGAPTPDAGGRLLVADGRQLWISGDGRTWQARPLTVPAGVRALAAVPARTGVLVVVTLRQPATTDSNVQLFRSVDGGGRWTEVRLPHPAGGAAAG